MSFSFIASANGYAAGFGTTLDASSTLNVAASDLLVAVVTINGNGVRNSAVADTGGTNSMTMLTEAKVNDASVQIGYRLVGEANATATFRLSTSNIDLRGFVVFQFRPDAGDTVALDTGPQSGTNAWSSAASSGNITTTGTDEVVVGGVDNVSARTYSARNIGGAAAGGYVEPEGSMLGMYTLYTATQTDIPATATLSSQGTWAATIAAFIATAAGGTQALAASVTAVSSLGPMVSVTYGVGAAPAAVSTVSGDANLRYNFGASVTAVSTVTGMAWVQWALSNVVAGVSTLVGKLTVTGALARRFRVYMRGVLRKGIR